MNKFTLPFAFHTYNFMLNKNLCKKIYIVEFVLYTTAAFNTDTLKNWNFLIWLCFLSFSFIKMPIITEYFGMYHIWNKGIF